MNTIKVAIKTINILFEVNITLSVSTDGYINQLVFSYHFHLFGPRLLMS